MGIRRIRRKQKLEKRKAQKAAVRAEKKRILADFLGDCRRTFARRRQALDVEYLRPLGQFIEEIVGHEKAVDYLRELQSGNIFVVEFRPKGKEPSLSFTVLPDNFLREAQIKKLEMRSRRIAPERRVVTLSWFEGWALKNLNFAELRKGWEAWMR
jgi:hypothetical protein